MRWFVCIVFIFAISIIDGCANTATKIDEMENLKLKVTSTTGVEQLRHLADVVVPEYKKYCKDNATSKTVSDDGDCSSIAQNIATSYMASGRYNEAIPFIKRYAEFIIWQQRNTVGEAGLCSNHLANINYSETKNGGYVFYATLNLKSALFLALDKNNDPLAANYVIPAYLCSPHNDHISRGSIRDDFPGTERFKSDENFYKDLNKYLGQSGEKQGRFYIKEIHSHIEKIKIKIEAADINTEEKNAKKAALFKNATAFAIARGLPQSYLDYLNSSYKIYAYFAVKR